MPHENYIHPRRKNEMYERYLNDLLHRKSPLFTNLFHDKITINNNMKTYGETVAYYVEHSEFLFLFYEKFQDAHGPLHTR